MTTPRKPQKITIKEIAKALSLSPQAVSQALNDYSGTVRVSADTRARVRALAELWNYRPHAGARALRSQTHRNIGYIEVKPPPNSHFLYLISAGVLDAAEEHGYQVTFIRLLDDPSGETRVPKALREVQLDAAIIVPAVPLDPPLTRLVESLGIPFVTANARLPHNAVYPDNRGGTRILTAHLLEQGLRDIAYLRVPSDAPNDTDEDRCAGYLDAMTAAERQPRIVEIGSDAMPQAFWARQPLTPDDRRDLPEAFVCHDDFTALHLFNMLYAAGIRVPDDIAIAGFGDNVYASVSAVPLTTVHVPYREIGRAAVTMALDLLKSHGIAPSVQIPVSLRARQSSRRGAAV